MNETSNNSGNTPNKALNKVMSKDKLQLNKAKQTRAMNDQSSKSKDQSMKANQNITILL